MVIVSIQLLEKPTSQNAQFGLVIIDGVSILVDIAHKL